MLRRFLLLFQKQKRCVGVDFYGNQYYETVGEQPKRWVQFYGKNMKPEDYKPENIPVEWSRWLSYTRKDAPSLEELKRNSLQGHQLQQQIEYKRQCDRQEVRSSLSFHRYRHSHHFFFLFSEKND
jgi:NADH dehydrogenase [ubiquinone] 1 alpha subcomplex assembly factor 2